MFAKATASARCCALLSTFAQVSMPIGNTHLVAHHLLVIIPHPAEDMYLVSNKQNPTSLEASVGFSQPHERQQDFNLISKPMCKLRKCLTDYSHKQGQDPLVQSTWEPGALQCQTRSTQSPHNAPASRDSTRMLQQSQENILNVSITLPALI